MYGIYHPNDAQRYSVVKYKVKINIETNKNDLSLIGMT